MNRKNMRTNSKMYAVVIIFVIITFSSCSSVPRSFKEITLDDMYPILTNEQYKTLESLNSDEEIIKFLDEFWKNTDSALGLRENEFKTEYLRRLAYANEYFPDRRARGRSDRKRIYLIYGPPSYIERHGYTNIQIGRLSSIKSMEIWLYMTGGNNNALPSQGDDIFKGEKKFIFGDTGSGIYEILYSSEDKNDIDVRLFKHN